MKKKKVFIAIIIATLLLAGLLFYWNNNEVHACEAVSLEEARGILTEENVLLEYVCWEDVDSDISYKQEQSLYEEDIQIDLIICEDGSVYYCSFYYSVQYTMEEVFDHPLDREIEEKIQNNSVNIFYFGKLSTWDTIRCHIGRLCADNNKMYTEEYRYLDYLHMEPSLDDTSATTDGVERICSEETASVTSTPFCQHENYLVQSFLDETLHNCNFCIGEERERIHFKHSETRGTSQIIFVSEIGEMLRNSYFFERFAITAWTEIYTRRNPIIMENEAFVYEGAVVDGDIMFLPNNRAEQIVWHEEETYYSIDGQTVSASRDALVEGRVTQTYANVSLDNFIIINDSMFAYNDWSRDSVYRQEGNAFRPVISERDVWKLQSDGEYLYCTDIKSLVRMDMEGNIETLWEHAVYAFTVDENYIYIFDGNTWQVLDKETGENLGHIATDVHFTYDMDEIYAAGDRLYFAAWNRENNTISCNSLDMEGNLVQIGEMHEGTEVDSRLTTCYGEYIYYVINDGTQVVSVNVNTNEETIIDMDEFGIAYIDDILIWEDYFVVYGYDGTRCLLCMNTETMELEEKIYLE